MTAAEITRADTLLIARALDARPSTAAELATITQLPGWRIRQLLHRAGNASPKPEFRYFIKRHDCYCLTDRGRVEFAADLAATTVADVTAVAAAPVVALPERSSTITEPVDPVDYCGERPLPEPTDALPGTKEKLLVLEDRRRRKQQLHNPLDAQADAESGFAGILAALTSNSSGERVHRSGT